MRTRTFWTLCLFAIVATGIASRMIHTGLSVFDKYLGDALYAAMFYVILRLRWNGVKVAVVAFVIVLAMELFQLIGIPANLAASDDVAVHILARLLGTEFSLLDIAAYAVGIACIRIVDLQRSGLEL